MKKLYLKNILSVLAGVAAYKHFKLQKSIPCEYYSYQNDPQAYNRRIAITGDDVAGKCKEKGFGKFDSLADGSQSFCYGCLDEECFKEGATTDSLVCANTLSPINALWHRLFPNSPLPSRLIWQKK